MNATFQSCNLLKQLIDAMKELIVEANFECLEDGIHLNALDTNQVSFLCLHLKREEFQEYSCSRPITLGINLQTLSKILKCLRPDEECSLCVSSEKDDSLQITFESEDRISEFEMNLVDIMEDKLVVPETKYPCECQLPVSEFQKMCKDLSSLGDTCIVRMNSEKLELELQGLAGTGMIKTIPSVLQCTKPCELSFALRYLNKFTKASSLTENVTIGLHPELPLAVKYTFQEGSLHYYLAPKITND